MTKTTIFLSFLLLLFGQANSQVSAQLQRTNSPTETKQHWILSKPLEFKGFKWLRDSGHWQNPLSLCHLNPLNDWPEITCTSGKVTQFYAVKEALVFMDFWV